MGGARFHLNLHDATLGNLQITLNVQNTQVEQEILEGKKNIKQTLRDKNTYF